MGKVKRRVTHSHREEPPVVLYEHQGYADDGRTVLNPHRVRAHVSPRLPLQQVGPKDHRQVSSSHLVTWDLHGEKEAESGLKLEPFVV